MSAVSCIAAYCAMQYLPETVTHNQSGVRIALTASLVLVALL
jgi:hypothetical protein